MAAREQAARIVHPAPEAEVADAPATSKRETQPAVAPAESEPVVKPGSESDSAAPKSGRRRKLLIGIGAVAIAAAAIYGVNWFIAGRFKVATDDAYVRANNTMLGARVSGHITSIAVRDNARVKAGDVIFRIDDGDYRIAVDSALARAATQEATIARIGRQVVAAESQTDQAKAQLDSAEAASRRSQLDYDRQQSLSDRGFASKAVFETSQANRDQSAASVKSAQASFDAARDNVEVIKAQQQEAVQQLQELKSTLAKAQRDLDFTTVRSPIDGAFGNRLVNQGDYVAQGQRLGNLVPLDEVFVDANYKETQLKRIRVGQPAVITVDAYGSRKFKGTVESISPAAGSVFTLLPPDNATGNFTKIVQRLPVRIRVPKSVATQGLLRAGMSVYATVDTREGAHDADDETDLDDPVAAQPK